MYEADDEFAILMRMIAAFAFVPEKDMPQSFYGVANEMKKHYNNNNDNNSNSNNDNIDVVVDYFEDTYIERQRRGIPRATPMFPLNEYLEYAYSNSG